MKIVIVKMVSVRTVSNKKIRFSRELFFFTIMFTQNKILNAPRSRGLLSNRHILRGYVKKKLLILDLSRSIFGSRKQMFVEKCYSSGIYIS